MALPSGSVLRANNLFDSIFAVAMILLAVGFFAFMVQQTGTGRLSSYDIQARIPDAAGLRVGSDVRVGGVKIGRVADLSLDMAARQAVLTLRIRDDLDLPGDSYLVVTAPVMGDLYLTVMPGHGARTLRAGETLYPQKVSPPRRNPLSS